MDRDFSSSERVQALMKQENQYFVLRIKNNSTINMKEDGTYELWSDQRKVQVRLVTFSDLEIRTEFRFVTNLPESGELAYTNEHIGEIYRRRWQIELLWKFLKMHLKLARIITKNTNGIKIQIYACLMCYLLLKLVELSDEIGNKLLDKLRYLQDFMCEKSAIFTGLRNLFSIAEISIL